MALATVDYFKLFAQITDDSQDGANQIYLDQASAMIIATLGRDIVSTTYPGAAADGLGDSGYYRGQGTRKLVLRQRPVTAIASIYLDPTGYFGDNPDGSFASSTLLTLGRDYLIDWDGYMGAAECSRSGIVERIGGVWPAILTCNPGSIMGSVAPGRGNIKVAYTAGYSIIPPPIRAATCELAAWIRRNADKGGAMQSESLGGYSYSLSSPAAQAFPELGSIRGLLAPYREQAV